MLYFQLWPLLTGNRKLRMIPTHQLDKTNNQELIVIHLDMPGNNYNSDKPHRHNYFEFFYFENGGGVHVVDFIEFPIQSNSVHIVAPGQIHQVKREATCHGFVILFELNAIKAPGAIDNFLFEHACMNAEECDPTYKLNELKASRNSERINNIWNYFQSNNNLDSLSLLNEFYAFCIDCMKKRQEKLTVVNSDYMRFRKFLSLKYKELKKVQDYAELMNMSDKSLNNLVKKYSGKNTSQVIFDQIILEAKRLLLTGISIKESAYDLKFDDPAHFSKFFRTQTGMAPSVFQNLHGKN
jgi:AraC family transcriptional activator of pobA